MLLNLKANPQAENPDLTPNPNPKLNTPTPNHGHRNPREAQVKLDYIVRSSRACRLGSGLDSVLVWCRKEILLRCISQAFSSRTYRNIIIAMTSEYDVTLYPKTLTPHTPHPQTPTATVLFTGECPQDKRISYGCGRF